MPEKLQKGVIDLDTIIDLTKKTLGTIIKPGEQYSDANYFNFFNINRVNNMISKCYQLSELPEIKTNSNILNVIAKIGICSANAIWLPWIHAQASHLTNKNEYQSVVHERINELQHFINIVMKQQSMTPKSIKINKSLIVKPTDVYWDIIGDAYMDYMPELNPTTKFMNDNRQISIEIWCDLFYGNLDDDIDNNIEFQNMVAPIDRTLNSTYKIMTDNQKERNMKNILNQELKIKNTEQTNLTPLDY